jgi:molybdate transport system regulatory protein
VIDMMTPRGFGWVRILLSLAVFKPEEKISYDGGAQARRSMRRKRRTQTMAPVIRIRIDFADNVHVGPGKVALLEAIKSTGSISDAARSLGMSYRRAWMLINSLKQGFSEAVTISAAGGAGGGGARVTSFGSSLIKQYRTLEREVGRLGAQRLTDIVPHVSAKASRSEHAGKRQLAKKIIQRAEKIS